VTGRENNHDDRIAAELADVLADYFRRSPDQAMVIKWTMQVEVIDNDGTAALWTLGMPNMALWERQAFTRHALRYYDFIQDKANEEAD
jgi:hypothetical protein